MPAVRYLTIQDVLWVNTLIVGSPQPFEYSLLEESCFFQYGYGASTDIAAQAASFLVGFADKSPFDAGNEATAFVGCAAFLALNGWRLAISDRELKRIMSGSMASAGEALTKRIEKPDPHSEPEVEAAISAVFEAFPETIASLSGSSQGSVEAA